MQGLGFILLRGKDTPNRYYAEPFLLLQWLVNIFVTKSYKYPEMGKADQFQTIQQLTCSLEVTQYIPQWNILTKITTQLFCIDTQEYSKTVYNFENSYKKFSEFLFFYFFYLLISLLVVGSTWLTRQACIAVASRAVSHLPLPEPSDSYRLFKKTC